jgi:L-seryl-tRNA(Ser) seleniumtransferase
MQDALRNLPPVNDLLIDADMLIETFGRAAVLEVLRATLDETRTAILQNGATTAPDKERLLASAGESLAARFAVSLRPVINATGVVLHTNLGRAPLAASAIDAIQRVAAGYSNLEYDLSTGGRGKRQHHIEAMVAQVIGAPAAMVVNNAASAVMLTLSALAKGREVVISRGQLVEIGGGFRVPDVMAQSGALLVEVGTTNRTRLDDYARAITEQTALLMRAHASNFRMMGFTEETPLVDMANVAHQHEIFCVDDLGSGALLDTASFGLSHEPTVAESLAAGVDAVMFSGDKLLGGPQAGIIAGKTEVLDQLKGHPLARAIRVDKLTIAALVATLDHYRRGQAVTHIPVWQMIARPLEDIENAAKIWADAVPGDLLQSESTVGGGSLPGETLPTVVFAPHVDSANDAQATLRAFDPPVIARVKDERLLLDPRTVLAHQMEAVAAALRTL